MYIPYIHTLYSHYISYIHTLYSYYISYIHTLYSYYISCYTITYTLYHTLAILTFIQVEILTEAPISLITIPTGLWALEQYLCLPYCT